jgi:hypothetical protein
MQTQIKDHEQDNRIGFRCAGPGCEQWIGDPDYSGPLGHAPQNLCFECWMAYWDKIEALAVNGGHWTRLDEALWLFCRGMTFAEAAEAIATHQTTLQRWIAKIRCGREIPPVWLIHLQDVRQQRHEPQN